MRFHDLRRSADLVRSIPLEDVLVETGAERDPYDREKWRACLGVICVTGTKFFNWTHEVGGGGAIDLVIHLEELSFKAAVEWLVCRFPNSAAPDGPVVAHSQLLHPSRRLELPLRSTTKLPGITNYLVRSRCLDDSVIEALVATGLIYADEKGNAVFLMHEDGGDRCVGAELRGSTAQSWKGMAIGSQKNLGYFSIGDPDAKTVVLCESAIDALSCYDLHRRYRCISTAGARPNPSWLTPLLSRGQHVVCCGFDADSTGDETARAMIAQHPAVRRIRPHFHDWNDVLRAQT